MYPLKTEGEPFAYNQWYVAAWSHEVSRKLFERQILGESICMYRDEAGKPVALNNMCPHRKYALSKGELEGDTVTCAYHGFSFAASGKCVAIPSQEKIPANFGVRSYPMQERWQWLWIWMGDPALADPSLIPDLKWLKIDEPGWTPTVGGVELTKARYLVLHDNLLDLSHLTHLHNKNIGSRGIAATRVEFEVKPTHLELWRHVKSDEFEHTPLGKLLGVKGLVDRTMEQQFFAPGLHVTGPAFRSAEKGGIDPGRPFGEFRVLHGITPETAYSTHYFWGVSRHFAQDNPQMGDTMRRFLTHVIAEDVEASETIERLLQAQGDQWDEISAVADAPAIRGRRMLQELIDKDPPRSRSAKVCAAAPD